MEADYWVNKSAGKSHAPSAIAEERIGPDNVRKGTFLQIDQAVKDLEKRHGVKIEPYLWIEANDGRGDEYRLVISVKFGRRTALIWCHLSLRLVDGRPRDPAMVGLLVSEFTRKIDNLAEQARYFQKIDDYTDPEEEPVSTTMTTPLGNPAGLGVGDQVVDMKPNRFDHGLTWTVQSIDVATGTAQCETQRLKAPESRTIPLDQLIKIGASSPISRQFDPGS